MMSTAPRQTKVQRLAYALRNWPDIRIDFNAAADLLRRQDELLWQALEALENSHYDVGSETKQRLAVVDAITAIRAQLEAK